MDINELYKILDDYEVLKRNTNVVLHKTNIAIATNPKEELKERLWKFLCEEFNLCPLCGDEATEDGYCSQCI